MAKTGLYGAAVLEVQEDMSICFSLIMPAQGRLMAHHPCWTPWWCSSSRGVMLSVMLAPVRCMG